MKRELIPSWEDLERHRKVIPEIKPAAVIAMLELKEAGADIQEEILGTLRRDYHLSEGKFCTLIVLHQNPQGIAPSQLAAKVGVTRATVSVMLQHMADEGTVTSHSDENDGRGKVFCLTKQGRDFVEQILPPHYLRVTKLMEKLTEELIRLLRKMQSEN